MSTPRVYGTVLVSGALLLAAGAAIIHMRSSGTAPLPARSAPPPPEVAHWTPASLRQLLAAVDASRDEGLQPEDYQRDALADALRPGPVPPAVETLATAAARALAHDYAGGRIIHKERFDWHIAPSPATRTTLDTDLVHAVNTGRLSAYLSGLLPTDPRYVALRDALRKTPGEEADRIAHIRASMERWRWMPRTLGADYIWVNVPTYRLALYRGEDVITTHDVVVGAPETPTPMLAADVGSIIVNPWWTLPPTVLREGKRYSSTRGYVYVNANGRTRIRQRPGPDNALGRMKIDMPNAWAIYLHDTPAKWAFAKTERALSHGCIRVKDIASLGRELSDEQSIDDALQTYQTRTLQVGRKVPVYIVYFTAAPDADGKVVTYGDPYERDAPLIAALDRRQGATRAPTKRIEPTTS